MMGFIDILHTPLGTTGNYRAVVDLHTLEFTVTHTYTHHYSQPSLVISWQRIYNNRLIVTAAHYEVFFAQPIPFLSLFCQLPTQERTKF
jgi:hypothetical protein